MPSPQPPASIESDTLADDMLKGAPQIARFTGDTERQVQHQLESGYLPAFKIGGRWHMRKSTYRQMVARLETRAMQGA